jgi:phage gpG-like protein
MAVRVRITDVEMSALRRRFAAMTRRSTNFSSMFRWALRQLQDAESKNFASQGHLSGGGWKPLDNEYAAWKLANYGAGGILVREGNLRSSLTNWNARGAIRDVGATSATFGTSLPYAKYHEGGTFKMPARQINFVPRTFADRLARAAGEHVVYGGEVGNIYTHLKGALFT